MRTFAIRNLDIPKDAHISL